MPGSTYSESHRKYYQEHKQEIREKRKTNDKAYYERHKEAIKAKNLARYYTKKGVDPNVPNVPNVIYLEAPSEESPALPAAIETT